MKNSLIVLLLTAAIVAAQAQAAPAGQQQPQPGAAAPVQQKKVIQDPNEYNAYVAAVNATVRQAGGGECLHPGVQLCVRGERRRLGPRLVSGSLAGHGQAARALVGAAHAIFRSTIPACFGDLRRPCAPAKPPGKRRRTPTRIPSDGNSAAANTASPTTAR